MRVSIPHVLCWLSAFTGYALALSLMEALASYPQLSVAYGRINGSAVLAPLLAGADDFTFFAPTNAALETFFKGQLNGTQDAMFQAMAQYSLIKGGYPSVAFTKEPQFVASNLTDAKYANVTGGQVLELVERNGQPQVVSGNQSVSTLSQADIVCAGGLVHIIDTPISLPAPTVNAITYARLGYFVSILTRGGYLSRTTNQYVHALLDSRDVTYFIPNTATALSNFTTKAESWSEDELKRSFQYHVVPQYLGYSGKLKNGTSLTTAEGTNLTITRRGDDTYVNAAKILSTDYLTSNGVIHVIEELLDRNNTSPPPLPVTVSSTTSSATPTPNPTPSESTPTTTPTSEPTAASTSTSNNKSDLTLKVSLGAGLGGALLIFLIILVMVLRRRKGQRQTPVTPQRESSVWEHNNTASASTDTKKYFVNRDGRVQQRTERDSGPPGYSMGMVPVTNLEAERKQRDSTVKHYSASSGGSRMEVPMRSPDRLQTNEKGYF